MKNCLVKTLLQELDFMAYRIMGKLVFRIPANITAPACITFNHGVHAKIENGYAQDIEHQGQYTEGYFANELNIYPERDNCVVIINLPLYDGITTLRFDNPSGTENGSKFVFDAGQFSSLSSLSTLKIGDKSGAFGTWYLQDMHLNEYVFDNSKVHADISTIQDKASITYVRVQNSPYIKGTIRDLATAYNCRAVEFTGDSVEAAEWESSSLRSEGLIICGTFKLKDSTSVDNFLINMASLTLSTSTIKSITINGADRTSASNAAVATIKAKKDANNVSFDTLTINGVVQ